MNKKLISITIVMFCTSMFLFVSNSFADETSEAEIKIISVIEAKELIESNSSNPDFIILDVRTDEEFKSGHISNSLNIDYKSSDFREKVSALDKDKTYVTYCRSGRRSTGASEIMKEEGIHNIYMIEGGMLSWQEENLPVQ